MLSSLPIAFSAPLALAALALLPALWLILRVTPPRPRRIDFPPLKIMADLIAKREMPAHTPWWLLALRMAVAALAILAVAGPVWNPPREAGPMRGPMLLLIDNGFGAATDWPERQAISESRLAAAAREGRPVAIVGLAEASGEIALSEPRAALDRLRALALQPHAPDRSAHLQRIEAFLRSAPEAETVWVSDGLSIADDGPFLARLKQEADARRLSIHAGSPSQLALTSPENLAGALAVKVLRPTSAATATGHVRALDLKGLPLGDAPFIFNGSDLQASARLTLPIEVRNAVSRLEIVGERSAAAVALLDDRAKRRRVGIVSGTTTDTAQPLLSPTYYVSRALSPFAEIREPRPGSTDPIGELLAQNLSVLVLADIGALDGDTVGKINSFIQRGGVLLRFAGARLAAAADDLTPVRLRRGGRTLGGGLSWETPRKLAPFTRESPFFGIAINDDVRVSRQILAEPEADLAKKTWAALEDGTPVVTGERRGDGMIAMMHVTADTTWSNLPLSGLFVDMLRKVVSLAGTGPSEAQGEDARVDTLSPTRVLDGHGAFRSPPATAQPVARTFSGRATLAHPPGIYGPADGSLAVNALNPADSLKAIDLAALGAPILPVDKPVAFDIRPQLLVLALLCLIADTLATLWLGGRLNIARRAGRAAPAAILLALVLVGAATPEMARAQAAPTGAADDRPPIPRELFAAGAVTRLAYVVTGDKAVDDMSKAGLAGLNVVLGARTALEPGEAVGVNADRDELAFFPVLYWPIVAGRPIPAPETLRKLEAYMKGGGLVIFDTRDAMSARPGGGTTPEGEQLRRMLQTLDIPELEPLPRDHVLTKTFYILDGFVGRYDTGTTWVEILPPAGEDGRRPARAGDNVSPIVITSNDLASAWAVGRRGEGLVPLSGSDPRQREMALRAGVNLVMYALTGNYKADQVHVPALLERLGQ
ncbi:N-terminal double-transmembrane domain-containing protein [Bosea sp. OK403]|nr:N-terminal double-transmembrane domain-containing protein [Bosea sp. OK403]